MYPRRTHLIILRPRHEPLTDPLIHHKHHLGRHLRAQKARFLRPELFPLGEILRHLLHPDVHWCLPVFRRLHDLCLLRSLLLLVGLLHLELGVEGLAGWSEVRGCCGEEEGVYTGRVVVR